MWYIRFLKAPEATVTPSAISITTKVTVTTDLGDCSFPSKAQLRSTVRLEDDIDTVISETIIEWPPNAHCVSIEHHFSNSLSHRAYQLHVASKSNEDILEDIDFANITPILSVCSAPMSPISGIGNINNTARRYFQLAEEKRVVIWEENGNSIARHLWDAGVALSSHIAQTFINRSTSDSPLQEVLQRNEDAREFRIIELGCGCGIVGITLAQLCPGCRVVMTDLPEAAHIALKNIRSNKSVRKSKVTFEALDWQQPVLKTFSDQTIDLIVLSDCTYNFDSSPMLVKTIGALVDQSPCAMVVVAMKKRHAAEAVFFDLMLSAGLKENHHETINLPGTELGEQKIDIYFYTSNSAKSLLK